jgi:hypothetical protein
MQKKKKIGAAFSYSLPNKRGNKVVYIILMLEHFASISEKKTHTKGEMQP